MPAQAQCEEKSVYDTFNKLIAAQTRGKADHCIIEQRAYNDAATGPCVYKILLRIV